LIIATQQYIQDFQEVQTALDTDIANLKLLNQQVNLGLTPEVTEIIDSKIEDLEDLKIKIPESDAITRTAVLKVYSESLAEIATVTLNTKLTGSSDAADTYAPAVVDLDYEV